MTLSLRALERNTAEGFGRWYLGQLNFRNPTETVVVINEDPLQSASIVASFSDVGQGSVVAWN